MWPGGRYFSITASRFVPTRPMSEQPCLISYQLDVAFDRLDHRVHFPVQCLVCEAEGEAFGGMERNMRRQRQCVGIDHRVHHDWTAPVRKRRSEPFSYVAWFFDADAFRTHRLGDFSEIRVLEIDAEWNNAGFLHLIVDEVGELLVDSHLNHR